MSYSHDTRIRSRSRSKDRSKHKHHHREHKNESSSKFDDFGLVNFERINPGNPSNTIMLRQLPLYIEDSDLRTELNSRNIPYKDCRLVKSRETGASRGFAFVEFSTIEEAQTWVESTQGTLLMHGDARVQLFYSQPKWDEDDPRSRSRKALLTSDWDCAKCGIKNFKRRDHCFKCNLAREESDQKRGGEGYEHIGSNPCNTLVLRGLDALTSEDTIKYEIEQLTELKVKNAFIAREKLTNLSTGFAFIEMYTILDASMLMEKLGVEQQGFEIDGKHVNVNYCKNNYSTALTQLDTTARVMYPQADTSYYEHKHHHTNHSSSKVNQADQANSAAAVAQAALKNMQKKQELLSHLTNTMTNDYKIYAQPDISTYTYDESSGYYYDSSTGFYYDANSQYYYNPSTQQYMYWDALKSTYIAVIHNTEQKNVNVASLTTVSATSAELEPIVDTTLGVKRGIESEEGEIVSVKSEIKKPKTNSASQIAKNMEKWAESMNKKKKVTPITTTSISSTLTTTQPPTTQSSSIPIINNLINSSNKNENSDSTQQTTATTTTTTTLTTSSSVDTSSSLNKKVLFEPNNQQQATSTVTASVISSSGTAITNLFDDTEVDEKHQDEKQVFDETKLVDMNKLACLLCKRKFDSVDLLNKHTQLSNLHKANLDKYRQENRTNSPINLEIKQQGSVLSTETSDSLLAAIQYRDRAQERRQKYGAPEPPLKFDIRERLGISNESSISASPYNETKNTSSIANKLMRKMGWNEGSGLGRNNQGISAPIEASVRQKGLGLGASSANIDPNDSYKDAVRKSARARFDQLN